MGQKSICVLGDGPGYDELDGLIAISNLKKGFLSPPKELVYRTPSEDLAYRQERIDPEKPLWGNVTNFMNGHLYLPDILLTHDTLRIEMDASKTPFHDDTGYRLGSNDGLDWFMEDLDIDDLRKRKILEVTQRPETDSPRRQEIAWALSSRFSDDVRAEAIASLHDMTVGPQWVNSDEIVRLRGFDIQRSMKKQKARVVYGTRGWKGLLHGPFWPMGDSLFRDVPVVEDVTPGFNRLNAVLLEEYGRERLGLMRKRYPSAYELLNDYFQNARDSLYRQSLALHGTFSFHHPFSIGVILRDIRDGNGPKDFYDELMSKRKDFRHLRRWLGRFQETLACGDIEGILKTERELLEIGLAMEEEFGGPAIHRTVNTWSKPFSLLLNPITAIVEWLDRGGGRLLERLTHPHRAILHRIGKSAGASLEKELKRCFPYQGETFLVYLKYSKAFEEKVDEVLKLGSVLVSES